MCFVIDSYNLGILQAVFRAAQLWMRGEKRIFPSFVFLRRRVHAKHDANVWHAGRAQSEMSRLCGWLPAKSKRRSADSVSNDQ